MTVNLKLGEPLVDAAVDKIQRGLATRLATIEAQYDDGIALEVPQDSSYYTAGQESFVSPAVFVIEGQTATIPEHEGQHELETATHIAVYIAAQDYDRQRLAKKLQRYARAVTECIWDDAPQERLTGVGPWAGREVAYRIVPIGTRPGAAFDPERDDDFGAFYIVVFAATQLEGA